MKVKTKRAGVRWDRVVEKVWKDIGGNQEDTLSRVKFRGYKTDQKKIQKYGKG